MRPVRGQGGAHAGRGSRAHSAAGFTCSPPRATPRGWRPRPNVAPRPSQLPVPGDPRDLPRCGTATSNSGARRPAANCPEHALCGPPAATLARKENKEPGGPWRPAREVRPGAPSFYQLQCFFFSDLKMGQPARDYCNPGLFGKIWCMRSVRSKTRLIVLVLKVFI